MQLIILSNKFNSVGKMGSLKYNGRHTAHKPESTVGKVKKLIL